MSIIERQLNKKIEAEALKFFQQGTVPGQLKTFSMLRDFFSRSLGQPTLRHRTSQFRGAFDITGFNKSLAEIQFDLEVLFDESIEQINTIIGRFHATNVIHNTTSKELTRLINVLDEILITARNGDGHFQGFIERFDDLERTNQALTTPGVVDVAEGVLSLPQTRANNRRVPTNHLYNTFAWPVAVRSKQRVLSNTPMPGAGFGDAFSDILSAWRQRIVTQDAGPLVAEFTFPIAGPAELEKEVIISRIQLIPHSVGPFTVQIQKSVDNINYTTIPGHGEPLSIVDQSKVYNIDFTSELVQFLRFTIAKEQPDNQIEDTDGKAIWEYLFGFFNISMFMAGRVPSAVYISKPFTSPKPIGLAAINAASSMPHGTDIRFYLGLSDNKGTLQGIWHPVNPANSVRKDSFAQDSIRFGESARQRLEITAPAVDIVDETFKGVNIYDINPSGQLTGEPLFGTAILSRGENTWFRNREPQKEIFDVRDVYVDFSSSDNQSLYIVDTEIVAPQGISGSPTISLALPYKPYYDPTQGHTIVPAPGVDPTYDEAPTYAIYKTEWVQSNSNIVDTFSNVRALVLYPSLDGPINPDSLIVKVTSVTTTGSPVVENRILRADIDYAIDQEREIHAIGRNIAGQGNMWGYWGNQVAVSGHALDFEITYKANTNLTNRISKIDNNILTLDMAYGVLDSSDSIRVEYRRKIEPPAKILTDRIRAKKNFGPDPSIETFIRGQDYTVDAVSSSIYRIPNGNIPSDGRTFVDLVYEDIIFPVQTFSTWVKTSLPDFPDIVISSLTPNKAQGEQFLLSSSRGLVDISTLGKIPQLNTGWHQFIVKSLDPSNVSALINQVMKLADDNTNLIFQSRGAYFDILTSLREPMRQTTRDFLKKGILQIDNRFFAIDNNKILVNFPPGDTDDIYTKQYNLDQQAFINLDERFILEYTVRTRLAGSSNIIVKAELSRRPSADAGITPKVLEYSIRISP